VISGRYLGLIYIKAWECYKYNCLQYKSYCIKLNNYGIQKKMNITKCSKGQCSSMVEASWNVMVHAQKPDFVFRRNGRVHFNRWGRQFSWLLAAEVCALTFIVGSNAGYTTFRGSEKGTGYPLHSPVSPFTSPPVRLRVPSHFNWSIR
jgi:hypothetical protein